MTDFWDTPEGQEFADAVRTDLAPKVRDSDVAVSLFPSDGGQGDVKLWVELGAMIYMNKPIIVCLKDGQSLPPKLARIADKIVRYDGTAEDAANKLAVAAEELVGG